MKREVKIGIFGVTMIIAAWAGIRFLKGFDIFSRNSVYYAAYDQINGVQAASPIMMKGVKIGTVTGISFDPQRSDNVVLQFTIKRQYRIPTDSEAKIFSNGLMGAKAIEITYGTADTYLQKGDTLRSSRDRDLMDMAGSELDFFKQKVSQLTTDLSRTLENLNGLMETNADNIAGTLGNLNSVTGDMAEILSAEKNSLKSALDNLSKFSDMLGENAGRVDSIIGDVDRFTSQLTEEQFARKLSQAVEHLDDLVARIAQGEGTIGKLISDPELYDSLEKASDNLAALLADVKQYPGRYVHLSLFGRNPEKMKDNVYHGSVLPTMNKKLISNSLNVLYAKIGECHSKALTTEVSAYLMTAVAKMFRLLYSAEPHNAQSLFSVEARRWPGYSDAVMRMSESNVEDLLAGEDLNGAEGVKDPSCLAMTTESLTREYPLYTPSLLNLVKTSETHVRGLDPNQ